MKQSKPRARCVVCLKRLQTWMVFFGHKTCRKHRPRKPPQGMVSTSTHP